MFKYEDFSLRSMREEDAEQVLVWRNTERVRAVMYTDQLISLEQHLTWFEWVKNDNTKIYLIFEQNGKPLGVVNYTDIDRYNERCFFGMYIGEENALPGLGAVLEYMLLEYAFEELAIRKLCGEVLDFNEGVVALHRRFGFEQEGLFKKHVLKNEAYQDVIFMAMFREQWEHNKEKLQRLCFPVKRKKEK